MKLDRNNYEEFFLLYVDNELTAVQRKSVEQFVQENPDLTRELEILQQTVLAVDNSVVFNGKNSLLKNETGSLITLNNYEEYLISYIDDELNAVEKKEFEKFAMAHPQIKEELSIYLQTKMEPEEEIVFANKEVLYRREEKVRVFTMQWWKIAVAAAVILVAGVGTFTVLNKKDKTPDTDVVKTNKEVTKPNSNTTVAEDKEQKNELKNEIPSVEEAIQDNVATVTTSDAIKAKSSTGKEQTEEKIQTKKTAPQQFTNNEIVKTEVPVRKTQETNIATSTNNNNNTIDKRESPAVTQDALNNTVATIDNAKNTASKQNTNNDAVTINPDNTYNNKETAQEEFDAVYASNNESKNKKLRGFFRKATRVFEKRTNISATDDTEERIMIGALAVKLK